MSDNQQKAINLLKQVQQLMEGSSADKQTSGDGAVPNRTPNTASSSSSSSSNLRSNIQRLFQPYNRGSSTFRPRNTAANACKKISTWTHKFYLLPSPSYVSTLIDFFCLKWYHKDGPNIDSRLTHRIFDHMFVFCMLTCSVYPTFY